MEKSEYSFGAYRYFIVPNDQISLFDAIEEKRKKAVQNFFSALVEEKKRSWEIKGRKHLFVNYSRGIFEISMTLNSPNLFGGFNNTNEMLDSIKIGLFLNCIFSISDLFFSLSNILRLVLYENSTKQ